MNKDYDNTELFEPTHRDNEDLFSFDFIDTLLILAFITPFALLALKFI